MERSDICQGSFTMEWIEIVPGVTPHRLSWTHSQAPIQVFELTTDRQIGTCLLHVILDSSVPYRFLGILHFFGTYSRLVDPAI